MARKSRSPKSRPFPPACSALDFRCTNAAPTRTFITTMILRCGRTECVAAGRFDGFWEFGLKPWDTAAGVLLVQEAGGTISDFQGRPYALGGPVILATNSLIHEEMREIALAISQRDPAAPLQPPTQTVKE